MNAKYNNKIFVALILTVITFILVCITFANNNANAMYAGVTNIERSFEYDTCEEPVINEVYGDDLDDFYNIPNHECTTFGESRYNQEDDMFEHECVECGAVECYAYISDEYTVEDILSGKYTDDDDE